MELYSSNNSYKLYKGSMLDMLDVIEPNSIDSIITDPPYGLTSITKRFGKENSAPCQYGNDGSFARLSKGFMGKEWDGSGIEYNVEAWKKCFEVLKPGGYLLAFGGSRTFHRIACAIEDAGFEIRDTIMWLYGSGFPKSMNIGLAIDKKNGVESKIVGYEKGTMPDFRDVGKKQKEISGIDKLTFGQIENSERKQQPIYKAQNQWSGWGTALKPAYEPIIVARKPVENSVIENVMKYGVGGINIDECRVPAKQGEYDIRHYTKEDCFQNLKPKESKFQVEPQPDGRFPSNVIHDGSEEATKDMPTFDRQNGSITKPYVINNQVYGDYGNCQPFESYQDSGSASRYFYCAKASKKDRDEGCEQLDDGLLRRMRADMDDSKPTGLNKEGRFAPVVRKNTHPTVKPMELMQYLVRLVSPKGATILDCFNGSGSTGKAVMLENKQYNKDYKYIGIELTDEYLPIAKARIEYIINNDFDFWEDENGKEQHEVVDKSVTTLFDLEF